VPPERWTRTSSARGQEQGRPKYSNGVKDNVSNNDRRIASGASEALLCLPPIRPLAEIEEHLDSHKDYLSDLERKGKLFAAGPLLGEGARYDGNGLIVFRAKTREEAYELADNDPFHASGLRHYELFPWQVNEGSLEVRLLFSAGTFTFG
jgi:uncharacterized protein